MGLATAWVLFPLLLGVVALGHGLLAERLSGARIPGVLLLPLGLASIVVSSQFTSYWNWSAELTTPLVLLVGLVGWGLGWDRLRATKADRWAAAVAGAVFLVFAAPVVFSGEATFAGYGLLGDTVVHFLGADALLSHGRDFSGLASSAYRTTLLDYFGPSGYPSGGPTAIGALRPLVGQDVAWLFQPFLAAIASATALALYTLIGALVPQRPLRAVVVFVATQPALVLAYALQGSIKEIGTAFSVALLAALVPVFAAQREGGARRVVPLAIAAACALGIVGLAAAVWVGPVALAALVASRHSRPGKVGRRRTLSEATLFCVLTAALSWQAFATLRGYARVTQGVVTAQGEFGNLLGRLDPLQMFGVWPNDDYRLPLGADATAAYILIGVVMVAAALGALWIARARAWGPLLYLAASLVAWAYVTQRGSPWADAKALMIVSQPVMLAAVLGGSRLGLRGWGIESWLLLGAVAFGVLWSNALAYHNVSLAPRDRLAELQRIGARIAGRGPVLVTDFEEYAKHFLRRSAPTVVAESPARGALRRGQGRPRGFAYDIDALRLSYVERFPILVVRRGPAASRPPANYRPSSSGRYYDMWERGDATPGAIVEHFSLGGRLAAGGVASCARIRGLADEARALRGELAYVESAPSRALLPTRAAFSPNLSVDVNDALGLVPRGPARVDGGVELPIAGRWDVWVEGSFGRAWTVFVDGRRAGAAQYELNGRGDAERVGSLALGAGRHAVRVLAGGGDWRPGNGGINRRLGPVTFVFGLPAEGSVKRMDPGAWRGLCGRTLDWVEVLSPRAP